ncbi:MULTISPECIES: arsenite efflux transporter metallochaperone ArsD [Rhodococcus]|jgi:hypothetical protein|uniref:arsenite efflux transporter metallochaperone ArsD n=1 Tax=Rhodococcus TaxID=1827 RepID=UPI0004A8981E|nr:MULTISPECIES: arsenite efflux transporter metallochaperone ArsD [Rhodococcus]KLN73344.1 arsenic resistance operon repressor [Rhodococcus erythropolis]NHP18376.1 arsenite efflux transporter metallochaperone ArsD [Rhodococcus sp. IC4_135]KDQ00396.1 arsenic resistance operon repressor [Rhodococcus qingshengii]MBT9296638.1 arsenite efflux transporter metallochaperone ArsD [Rhodococcus sp. GOMB7]QEM25315.1 arsenite efflux transporter metallochaperone ArsD [Rhodococcus qingshengii]
MSTIEVFEPALCCNTGVCGDDVDQALITFTADLDWVAGNGGTITRHNLANDPLAFAGNDTVAAFLKLSGSEGLPLALVDGVTALTGKYPTRSQLAKWAGLTEPAAADAPAGITMLGLSDTSACCATDSTTCC